MANSNAALAAARLAVSNQFGQQPQPTFNMEGPQFYAQAMAQNRGIAKPGNYNTRLDPRQELQFRTWLAKYKVPFDPNAKVSDYDMRAYWKASNGNAHMPGQHFPDTYKTPLDTTFSAESQYANASNANVWVGNKLVNALTGKLVFNG